MDPNRGRIRHREKITVILEMTPLLNSVAFASLVGSTWGDMIRTTPTSNLPLPSMAQSQHKCPLRVLRDSIRSQCDLDVQVKCATTISDFPLFLSQQQHLSPFSLGFVSIPPPPIGVVSFIDLESMIDEMFSSTLQIFDEAMSANRQEIAKEHAVKAFDSQLPSFVENIISSASLSSSSSSSSSSSDEREIDNVPHEEEVFESLLGDIMDITSHIQISSERRRLSEGDNDPHLEMKNRLARRLTEYVSQTELFQLPGGGIMRVTSVSQVNETPKLGLGNVDLDECIYSSYKNGDLSSGCTVAVSSYMDFVNARRSGLEKMVQQTPIQSSLQPHPKDVTLLQTFQALNEDDSTLRYMMYGSIFSSVLVVISLCVLAVKSIRSFIAGIAMIVAAIFLGPVYMLAVLAVVFVIDQFYFSDDDDEEEEEDIPAVDFDYTKMEDDNDAVEANGQMEKPRVFIGVPVQVV